MTGSTNDLKHAAALIGQWTELWGVPELAAGITIEWSARLRRSLGHAYVKKQLIRLSPLLRDPQYAPLFESALCHEAAHVAVYVLHGDQARTHGPQWRELVRTAGFEPRRVAAALEPVDAGHSEPRYIHTCPVCQSQRYSSRPQRHWRCAPCTEAGLSGELIITSQPQRDRVDA